MKRIITAVLIAVVGFAVLVQPSLARTYRQPIGFVNDFANILSDQTIKDLENRLQTYEASLSHEIAVVTLSSLEGDTIENTAVELFQQWGIGKKNQDNGVLFLIAPNEKQVRLEVGYGLEPVLTDSRTGAIIREVITPEFKNNDYDSGVVKGVTAIQQVLDQDPTLFDSPITAGSTRGFSLIPLGIGLIFIYVVAFLSRSRRYWPGGVIGIILGFVLGAVTGAVFLGLFGLFFDYIFSKNYKLRSSKGLSTGWWSSKGGFSSGSSGGSFGGFGGGSSGGGGASGSW